MKKRMIIGVLLAVCLMLSITSMTAIGAVAVGQPALSDGVPVRNSIVNKANNQTVYFGQSNNSELVFSEQFNEYKKTDYAGALSAEDDTVEPGDVYCDVNFDGKVNAADLLRVWRHIKGKELLHSGSSEFINGDFDSDGKVTITDCQKLSAHLLGKRHLNTLIPSGGNDAGDNAEIELRPSEAIKNAAAGDTVTIDFLIHYCGDSVTPISAMDIQFEIAAPLVIQGITVPESLGGNQYDEVYQTHVVSLTPDLNPVNLAEGTVVVTVTVAIPSDVTGGDYLLDFGNVCQLFKDGGGELCALKTSPATLNISVPATAPTITAQPSDLNLTYGYADESLSVAAGDITDHTLSYKWYSCDDTNRTNPVQVGEGAKYPIPTGKNAGTTEYYYCVVTATCGSSYAETESRVAAVTVGKGTMTLTVTGFNGQYNAQPHTVSAVPGVADGTTVFYSIDGESWSTSAPERTEICNLTVLVKASNSNYNDATETTKLVITRAPATVTANSADKVFGTADPKFSATVTGIFANEDFTLLYSVTRPEKSTYEDAGSYPEAIVPDGDKEQGNYTVTYVAAEFTITKADAMTVAAVNYTGEYDGTPHEGGGKAEAVGTVLDDAVLSYSLDGESWTDAPPSITTAGTVNYFVKSTHKNYKDATAEGILTVSGNTSEIKITSADGEQEYSGSEFHKAEYTVTYGGQTVDANDDGSYTLPTGDKLTVTDTSKVKDVADTAEGNNEFTYVLENADQYSSVSTVFGMLTVKSAEQTSPATGDGNEIFIRVALIAVSGTVLVIAFRKRRTAVR